jgi:hypothetical protein
VGEGTVIKTFYFFAVKKRTASPFLSGMHKRIIPLTSVLSPEGEDEIRDKSPSSNRRKG